MSGRGVTAIATEHPTPSQRSCSPILSVESPLADSLAELSELAELWLERHVLRQDNRQVSRAIRQADVESRHLERKGR